MAAIPLTSDNPPASTAADQPLDIATICKTDHWLDTILPRFAETLNSACTGPVRRHLLLLTDPGASPARLRSLCNQLARRDRWTQIRCLPFHDPEPEHRLLAFDQLRAGLVAMLGVRQVVYIDPDTDIVSDLQGVQLVAAGADLLWVANPMLLTPVQEDLIRHGYGEQQAGLAVHLEPGFLVLRRDFAPEFTALRRRYPEVNLQLPGSTYWNMLMLDMGDRAVRLPDEYNRTFWDVTAAATSAKTVHFTGQWKHLRPFVRYDRRRGRIIIQPPAGPAGDDPMKITAEADRRLADRDDTAAIALYRRALAAAADHVPALVNLGFVLRGRQEIAEARSLLRQAVHLEPANAAAWANLTGSYVNEGEPEAGEAVAREALQHLPHTAEIHWNLALLLLEQGRWREGWREYRWRFETAVCPSRNYCSPRQPGRTVPRLSAIGHLRAGEVVLCHGEQGLGDEILFAGLLKEFVAAVQAQSAMVVFDPNPRLAGVFGRSFTDLPIISHGGQDQAGVIQLSQPVDWVVPIGDLGGFHRNETADFSEHSGYLRCDPAAVAALRHRLRAEADGLPLVGLAWTGGSPYTHSAERRIPLDMWHSVLRQPVRFVSLEYRDADAEITAAAAAHGVSLVHLPDITQAHDYERTCELVAALDLVITVPTSVLHVAGALGVPCWVVMSHRAAWRECSANDRLPWYPQTHRRFVRPTGDPSWEGVLERIAAEITCFAANNHRR